MNETKFTPGPWKQDYPNSIISLDGKQIAITYNSSCNARLIAAAPDMLNALIDAKKHLEEYCFGDNQERTDVFNSITKAIGKALT